MGAIQELWRWNKEIGEKNKNSIAQTFGKSRPALITVLKALAILDMVLGIVLIPGVFAPIGVVLVLAGLILYALARKWSKPPDAGGC